MPRVRGMAVMVSLWAGFEMESEAMTEGQKFGVIRVCLLAGRQGVPRVEDWRVL